jgi:hypothetical protein
MTDSSDEENDEWRMEREREEGREVGHPSNATELTHTDTDDSTHEKENDEKDDELTGKAYAFADDLAFATDNLRLIVLVMDIIDEFKEISGLGVNEDKTKILTRHEPTEADRELVASSSWPLVEFAECYKYLGVLMGREVSTHDIFSAALTKYRTRINNYTPIISQFSIQTRIIIHNVFLLPIFSYLNQFYCIPDTILKPARTACRLLIIPYHGTSMGYHHLTTPPSYFGYKHPLRDLRTDNLSRLASLATTLTDHNNSYTAHIPAQCRPLAALTGMA